jgi:hypothetical protein
MLNLHAFGEFMTALTQLYNASALSRTDLAKILGYDFIDQLEKLEMENKELTSRGLPTVGPNPFGSPATNQGGNTSKTTTEKPPAKKGTPKSE